MIMEVLKVFASVCFIFLALIKEMIENTWIDRSILIGIEEHDSNFIILLDRNTSQIYNL